MKARSLLLAAALALGASSLFNAAQAADKTDWPTHPIRILVGFPAGTSPDLTARLIADPLSKALGQPIVVDNRPGAGGNIAADMVAKSTDGHTLGVMINGNMTIAKLLNPKTPYEPTKDLAPISLIGTAPLVLTASMKVEGQDGKTDAASVLAAARAAGDKWSYGSPGIGTVGHIGMELLKDRTGIAPVHVPYPGYPQTALAMVAGDIQLSMLPPALALSQANAGKVRLLGVTSAARSDLAPGVPSLAEAGVKNFQLEVWNAVAGPASMPKPVVDKLSAIIADILRDPELRQRLVQQGWQVEGGSPEALTKRIKSDTETLGKIIRAQHISIE